MRKIRSRFVGHNSFLEPWPAWDGHDVTDLPGLIKTRGKTTTDHISPAGAWLRYRGRLDKFSRNMFMGATGAFSTAPGVGTNVVTGQTQQAIATIAFDYRERDVKRVLIGFPLRRQMPGTSSGTSSKAQ